MQDAVQKPPKHKVSMFKSNREAKDQLGEHTIFNRVNVYTLQPLPDHIDLAEVIDEIEESIPQIFFHDIDSIFIGHFKEFEERQVNAFYSDGALFITNNQSTDEDLLDDIVHETAHSVERQFPDFIYDVSMQNEFLSKRKVLFDRLRANGYNVSLDDFMDMGYSEYFDQLLYMEIGYPTLATITSDIFNSPYGATSIQEYWANGFEGFFVKGAGRIKAISPQVYKKITTLTNQYK